MDVSDYRGNQSATGREKGRKEHYSKGLAYKVSHIRAGVGTRVVVRAGVGGNKGKDRTSGGNKRKGRGE